MAQNLAPMKRNRFVNSCVSELEQEDRDRILSYRDVPLKSLEDAVRSIIRFVPHVMDYAGTAKRLCRQDTELTIDESAAVYLYTMANTFYERLNAALRAQNPDALKPWFPYLKLFLTAVEKLPSRPATVWRGVAGVIGSGFDEKDEHTWFSPSSCTSKVDVAGMFAGIIGTLFCIKAIYAKDIAKYSANHSEEEYLLMPGTHLRVNGRRVDPNGVSIVDLDEW